MKGLKELEQDPLITLIILDKRVDHLRKRFVQLERQENKALKGLSKSLEDADRHIANVKQLFPGVLEGEE